MRRPGLAWHNTHERTWERGSEHAGRTQVRSCVTHGNARQEAGGLLRAVSLADAGSAPSSCSLLAPERQLRPWLKHHTSQTQPEAGAPACIYACTHTHPWTGMHVPACLRVRTHAWAHSSRSTPHLSGARARMHLRTCTRTCTRTRTRAHAHARTRTRTRMHAPAVPHLLVIYAPCGVDIQVLIRLPAVGVL
jgi:hypothetical protein